jgi:hypothetical protein
MSLAQQARGTQLLAASADPGKKSKNPGINRPLARSPPRKPHWLYWIRAEEKANA